MNSKIGFGPSDTNSNMAAKIQTAINNAEFGGLQVSATAVMGIVLLEDERLSSLGNGTTTTPRLTESVATSNVAVVDMAGGAGGNCNVGTACASADDCASHSCSATTHLCQ